MIQKYVMYSHLNIMLHLSISKINVSVFLWNARRHVSGSCVYRYEEYNSKG